MPPNPFPKISTLALGKSHSYDPTYEHTSAPVLLHLTPPGKLGNCTLLQLPQLETNLVCPVGRVQTDKLPPKACQIEEVCTSLPLNSHRSCETLTETAKILNSTPAPTCSTKATSHRVHVTNLVCSFRERESTEVHLKPTSCTLVHGRFSPTFGQLQGSVQHPTPTQPSDSETKTRVKNAWREGGTPPKPPQNKSVSHSVVSQPTTSSPHAHHGHHDGENPKNFEVPSLTLVRPQTTSTSTNSNFNSVSSLFHPNTEQISGIRDSVTPHHGSSIIDDDDRHHHARLISELSQQNSELKATVKKMNLRVFNTEYALKQLKRNFEESEEALKELKSKCDKELHIVTTYITKNVNCHSNTHTHTPQVKTTNFSEKTNVECQTNICSGSNMCSVEIQCCDAEKTDDSENSKKFDECLGNCVTSVMVTENLTKQVRNPSNLKYLQYNTFDSVNTSTVISPKVATPQPAPLPLSPSPSSSPCDERPRVWKEKISDFANQISPTQNPPKPTETSPRKCETPPTPTKLMDWRQHCLRCGNWGHNHFDCWTRNPHPVLLQLVLEAKTREETKGTHQPTVLGDQTKIFGDNTNFFEQGTRCTTTSWSKSGVSQ